ncbi:MAG: DUF1573 domain-containing protein [Prevotella sp.]|jgi:hypothetical protein
MNKRNFISAILLLAAASAGAQRISTDKPLIDCGQVVYRQPVTAQFELTNDGRQPLVISNVRTSCGCTNVDYPKGAIPAGADFKVSITYDAKTMGHFTKLADIYSNGSEEPLTLTLRGVVVDEIVDFQGEYPETLGNLKAEDTEVEFDDVNRSDRPYKRIHIYNPTSETVEPVVMHLPKYLDAEVSPSRIAPGHGGVVTLKLLPHHLRDMGLTQTTVYLGMFPGDKVSNDKEINVSAVLLPNFENLTETQLQLAPKAQFTTEVLDLGSFNSKKKLKGEVDITNKGRSTLEIRSIQMFTTGIEVSLNKTKIEPGETAKLKVTAIRKMLRNVKSKPRILLITNDPQKAKVVIHINVKD